MFKYAFLFGIAAEWLAGAPVGSAAGFGFAALRALMLTLAAWMALEAARLAVQAVLTLDDGPSR